MSRHRVAISCVVAALVAVAVVVVVKVRHDRPPFGPETLQATARLWTVGYQDAVALVPRAPLPREGGQLIAGHVTWQKPSAEADGTFEIIMIDKRNHRRPYEMIRRGPDVDRGVYSNGLCCAGWQVLDLIEEKFSWLDGAADPRDGDKILSHMDTLSVLPQAGGVDFVALLVPPAGRDSELGKHWASAPAEPSDFLVALVYVGDDNQIYWAQRLYS